MEEIPGIGFIKPEFHDDLVELDSGGNGLWRVGVDGVRKIVTPRDRKVEYIVFKDHTLAYVRSALGYPGIYPLRAATFKGPAEAVLMDLDGTSVQSEDFWIGIVELTIAKLTGDRDFKLTAVDRPFVSGHSVSEHLQYCLDKYCPDHNVETARLCYQQLARFELNEIREGKGQQPAFRPSPGLREFLLALKANQIKIALVTSGLFEKSWPEIAAAFRWMDMGDPCDFYDTIICAGQTVRKGEIGTLGELTPKPHPWLYAEAARIGLGIPLERNQRVIGIEDSGAGIAALRLAGFAAIGLTGGNIEDSGSRPFVYSYCRNLLEALPLLLGETVEE